MATKIQLAVGLDAGSSRTRCIICALDGDHIRYLSHGLAESAGWAKGRVNDQVALAESIRAAVADAEHGAQIPVDSVTVGVGGVSVVGAQSRGRYEFGRPREVDAEDLAYAVRASRGCSPGARPDAAACAAAGFHARRSRRVSQAAQRGVLAPGSERSHRHGVVSGASVGDCGGRIWRGWLSRKRCSSRWLRRMRACFPKSGARSGGARHGNAFDRTWWCTTAIRCSWRTSIPVWADHFTRDIAAIFKVTYEDAECLKQQYGCALLGLTADSTSDRSSVAGRPASARGSPQRAE